MALRVSKGRGCPLQDTLQTPAKVRLREAMHTMDGACERLKPGWRREAMPSRSTHAIHPVSWHEVGRSGPM